MFLSSRHGLAMALLCPAGPVLAQAAEPPAAPPAASPAAACTTLVDPMARLACYDQLHGRAAPPAAPPAEAQAQGQPPQSPPSARPVNVAAQSATPSSPALERGRATAQCQRDGNGTDPATARHYLGSTLSERWELSCEDQLPAFLPRPYKPVYLLPVSWTSRANRQPGSGSPDHQIDTPLDLDKLEAKFQLSLKSKIWSLDDEGSLRLWGAYTQSSRWQLYNGRVSRPFRETNYEPELILAARLNAELPFGWKARLGSISLNHQSNGRPLPLSRSWNRVIGELALERGETAVSLRPWWRVGENSKDDDNPRIQDYVGRGELLVTQKWGRNVFSAQVRHSLRGGDRSRGSLQVDWAFPIGGGLHGYAQLFHGYGESLIDYNFRETRFGLGVSVVEWR